MKKNSLIIIIVLAVLALTTVLFLTLKNANNIEKGQEVTIHEYATETTETTVEEPTIEEETVEEETVAEFVEWEYNDSLKAEENIFIYLTDYLGFSDAAACGIIANIAYETGWKFNPDAGSPDRCYGLIQWLGGRLKKLKSWCEEEGEDYTTIKGQLDFMHWELVNDDPYGTYEHLMQVEDSKKGAYDAGWYFCYWYERPNRKTKASKWRGNEAKDYYEMLVLSEE